MLQRWEMKYCVMPHFYLEPLKDQDQPLPGKQVVLPNSEQFSKI